MAQFKAVIFDKDGVLINSLDTVFTAFNQTIEHFGLDKIARQRFIEEFWGVKGAEAAYVAKEKPGTNPSDVLMYFDRTRDQLEGMTKIFPSTIEVLTFLKHKKGCKLAVVTNTKRVYADVLLKRFGITQFFDAVVGGDEVDNPKPAPDSIQKACESLGVNPWEALYVGDTRIDAQAGKAAKCKTAILISALPEGEIKKLEGVTLIKDLKDLTRMF
jgi:HAD superfamily hydrolase (TIGR01549 family)